MEPIVLIFGGVAVGLLFGWLLRKEFEKGRRINKELKAELKVKKLLLNSRSWSKK